MKSAIILGATGLTGSILLQKLLNDTRYDQLIIFSRRSAEVRHPKIKEHLVDLFKLKEHKDIFKADEVYCCIGTTKSKTPNEEVYKKIDFGIPVTAAELAQENGISRFMVVSALGADPGSSIFYNRIKGEMEQEVRLQNIPETYFFQPSLIDGDRKEKRVLESLAKKLMRIGNTLLIGPLEKYRSIKAEDIAKAMIKVANEGYKKSIIPSNEIRKIALEEN